MPPCFCWALWVPIGTANKYQGGFLIQLSVCRRLQNGVIPGPNHVLLSSAQVRACCASLGWCRSALRRARAGLGSLLAAARRQGEVRRTCAAASSASGAAIATVASCCGPRACKASHDPSDGDKVASTSISCAIAPHFVEKVLCGLR